MRRLVEFISPWALAGLAVWIVVLGVVANWVIPVFAIPGLAGRQRASKRYVPGCAGPMNGSGASP